VFFVCCVFRLAKGNLIIFVRLWKCLRLLMVHFILQHNGTIELETL
jgi:hypothetical protein